MRFEHTSWFLSKIKQNYKIVFYYFLFQIEHSTVHLGVNVTFGAARLCLSGAERDLIREGTTFHPLSDALGMTATLRSAAEGSLIAMVNIIDPSRKTERYQLKLGLGLGILSVVFIGCILSPSFPTSRPDRPQEYRGSLRSGPTTPP